MVGFVWVKGWEGRGGAKKRCEFAESERERDTLPLGEPALAPLPPPFHAPRRPQAPRRAGGCLHAATRSLTSQTIACLPLPPEPPPSALPQAAAPRATHTPRRPRRRRRAFRRTALPVFHAPPTVARLAHDRQLPRHRAGGRGIFRKGACRRWWVAAAARPAFCMRRRFCFVFSNPGARRTWRRQATPPLTSFSLSTPPTCRSTRAAASIPARSSPSSSSPRPASRPGTWRACGPRSPSCGRCATSTSSPSSTPLRPGTPLSWSPSLRTASCTRSWRMMAAWARPACGPLPSSWCGPCTTCTPTASSTAT